MPRNKIGPEISRSNQLRLRRVGLHIHRKLFLTQKPVEWLAFKSGVARSSIREIIAGRSNFRILTLDSIARSLGYRNAEDLLTAVEKERQSD
jgi:hypothetical protein